MEYTTYNVTFVWNTQHTEGYNVTFVFIDNRETILHGKSESNHSFKDNNDMIYKIHQLHNTVNRLLLIELENQTKEKTYSEYLSLLIYDF